MDIEKGVGISIAKQRGELISELEYDLRFNIPSSKDTDIKATTEITFNLSSSANDILLDFSEVQDHLLAVTLNGQSLISEIIEEHIVLPNKYLTEGKNTVNIDFIAGNLSLNRNDEYLYTLLVPARARTVFPAFDQPDLKAAFKLSLTIPKHWEAVSNGPVESEELHAGVKTIRFKRTAPISTYLFAFAAGKFSRKANDDGTMTMFYRESDSLKVDANAPEIFKLHQSSLEWLEEYTGIPYPFQKFDFVLIPTFQYGGMEHPGSIFYRESALMLDPSASINQKLRRASLIAHETAHMWFGDLVTMKWFDDVWLKEVFANFMAAKIVHPNFPDVNHDLRFLISHYPRAYEIDRSQGSHPIQQDLTNLANAGSVYGAIIYQKSPIVMRNLEIIIGEENFRKGIQEYLNAYAFGNATWDDLIAIMDRQTDADLNKWNTDWVKTSGMPVLKFESLESELHLNILNQGSTQWPQEVTVKFSGPEQDTVITEHSDKWIRGIKMKEQLKYLFPNPDGKSYGYHQLDLQQIDLLKDIAIHSDDELERASAWIMLWESFLNESALRGSFQELVNGGLIREPNALILSYISDISEILFWRFTTDSQRKSTAEDMEQLLLERLKSEDDTSIQRIIFQLFIRIAITEASIEILRSMWSGTYEAMSLTLSDRDYEDLAYALALRNPEEGADILQQQILKLANPDSKKRMEYVMPSLSSVPEVRDSVFRSLNIAENRAVEPWVTQTLSFLHHPIHQKASIHYLRGGLDLLEEIQSTGDIFFPKNWLDAMLNGYSSKAARQIVMDYLKENDTLPTHLKNKVYQSSDMLFRIDDQD